MPLAVQVKLENLLRIFRGAHNVLWISKNSRVRAGTHSLRVHGARGGRRVAASTRDQR